MGISQVATVCASLVKMKVVALLLGPAGVGLVGVYLNMVQAASSIASLGISNAGTRQIATAHAEGGQQAVGRMRRVLFWGGTALSLIGATIFWSLSGWLAASVLTDESRASEVRWLAMGVALTVATASQSALLTGMRRIGDLALINIGVGITSSAVGTLALWLWGWQGLIVMVLTGPVLSFLLGHIYVARLGAPPGPPVRLPEMTREWLILVQLGFPLMISGLVTTLGLLFVRALVQREMGDEALGQFQAAWSVGMTYLGFVLTAMGTDYYPRLSAVISDPAAATRMINEQTEVALLLCGPPLLSMMGLAPWLISLLYSAEFAPAVEILRWQLLGDILKVLSWPLGFAILARGASKSFMLAEFTAVAVLVFSIFALLPFIGIKATGVAFIFAYCSYVPLVWWLGGRPISFKWTRTVKLQLFALISAAVVVELMARWSPLAGAVAGILVAGGWALWAWLRLGKT